MTVSESTGGIFFFSIKKRKKKNEAADEEFDGDNLLCRFVLDGFGKQIGESVAIDDDIIIIKAGSKYLGVPLKHVEEEEKTLLVVLTQGCHCIIWSLIHQMHITA